MGGSGGSRYQIKFTNIVQYKNAIWSLTPKGIHATNYHFQKRHVSFLLLKGLKTYQLKYECKVFNGNLYN